MKGTLTLAALTFLFLFIGTTSVEACYCSGRIQGMKGVQTCGYYQKSENIFVGLADEVEVDRAKGLMKVTFAVERSIRGTNQATAEVFTSASEASCGYPFKQGERYFVYGRKGSDGNFHESLCGPTTLLKDAEDDLEYVKYIDAGKLGTRIYGNVYDDIQPTLKDKRTLGPLPNIEITIKSKERRYKMITDQNGKYLFKDVPKDSYQVFAKLPAGYRELFTRADLTEHFAGSCSRNDFIVTQQGSILGRVVDFPSREIQNPWNRDLVQQPRVSLIPLDENNRPISNRPFEEKWAYHDKFEYFFDTVPAGNYLLAINPQNCPYPNNGVPPMFFPGVADRSEAKIISVKEKENLILTDFRSLPLLKERLLSGVVLNADKTPAANAVVRLLDGDRNNCGSLSSEVRTDEFGRFRLKGFETYEYKIEAYSGEKSGQKRFYSPPFLVPQNGENDNITLILARSF
jgi:Cna protein B-type domain.